MRAMETLFHRIILTLSLWLVCTVTTFADPWTLRHAPLMSVPSDVLPESPEHHYATFRKIDSTWHPGCYDLYQLNDSAKQVRAILWVSNQCKALIEQQAFFENGQRISLSNAKARFGEPRRFGHVAVFDLVGDYWKEPNIFHLDVEFDDHDIAQKYVVRGPGIVADQTFHDLDIKQIGKHDFPQAPKPKHLSKVFVIDRTAKIISAGYDQIMPFREGIAAIKQNDLWGYIDSHGKVLLKPTYTDTQSFSEGLAAVKFGKAAGFVGKDCKLAIPCKFEEASAFSDGLALVKYSGRWGYINTGGEFVIQPKYDSARSFTDGLAVVELDHMKGYIDKTGKIVGEMKFIEAYPFKNGFGSASPAEPPNREK